MAIKQLSVFVENRAGRLARVTAILEEAGISIRGFSLADTVDFGIARLVVDRPSAAAEALMQANLLVRATDLLCIELPDTPGALDVVFTAVGEADINVEYAYSLVSTYVVLKVADIEAAEELLASKPLRLASQDDLARPLAGGSRQD
ncbi:MAG: ACT domain-containing protein [Coriobacteriales bacterium]|jgi:hypothetical protein|nr:ACT domain-containing protein [Coriobacteriales bacterium]